MNKEHVTIGKIRGTHGIRGLVKVSPLTEFPQRFKNMHYVMLNRNGDIGSFDIESVQPYKDVYLMKFKGIDSSETAAEYRNALLQIDESDVYPLPEGYYYHFQLEGLSVYDTEKGLLGTIKMIIETGANDVYVIASDKYGEILIPAIKEVILAVDLEQQMMQVKLLPGLIEEK
ncbi:MAG: ribosome maturation factor RimM [Syntrophomonadaceae bacterium]|nr:ribosome maturation factor RimM [Syntrophomonadaceae bacterium]MDD3889412.1 ribosome maturation factor RimM [Syntrophomonadaceae bacterium]MDD4549514.1 ribosome maturation factor RimM [Syntrophomonadaceae bacterium]